MSWNWDIQGLSHLYGSNANLSNAVGLFSSRCAAAQLTVAQSLIKLKIPKRLQQSKRTYLQMDWRRNWCRCTGWNPFQHPALRINFRTPALKSPKTLSKIDGAPLLCSAVDQRQKSTWLGVQFERNISLKSTCGRQRLRRSSSHHMLQQRACPQKQITQAFNVHWQARSHGLQGIAWFYRSISMHMLPTLLPFSGPALEKFPMILEKL